jgi:sugar O-acyltransferase (sialic acid O-acetyltransferase NeuD family)
MVSDSGLWSYGEIERPLLIIIGAGEFAEIALEYFSNDSPYKVVGFAVERDYLKQKSLAGLPIVAYEEVESLFPPEQYSAFVAVTYTHLNRVRARLYHETKRKGYECARYVSSRAFLWHTVSIGENVFIFENNVLQHGVRIGNNVVLWSGNHIGHRAEISDHCYLASHVVVSGYCRIGESSFLGVNATLADNVTVGADNWIGPSVTIMRNTEPNLLFSSKQPEPAKVSARRFFKVREG